ncbi:HAD family hydrolase [Kordiimonas gwangyangensis]|uniref:HAD family hydrolase n=1 Tax=Kordiimonas gwangyangensis TaxID=288022 RepID=UPI00037D040C|nr:HAD family hydrolase [Kordiimonas gwangyangensis]
MGKLSTIGFDADDTLWENEQFFKLTEERFQELLASYIEAEDASARLLEAQRRNLGRYGFGIKGFMLSMVETAIDATDGHVPAATIGQILEAGRDMLSHPIELLDGVQETLEMLAPDYRLVLITKGDLFDQERKLAQSGLGEMFDGVEIVSNKTAATYDRIFNYYGDGTRSAMMVGNSLKSDVLPAIEVGSWGVFIPHELTWVIEHAEKPEGEPRFKQIADLGQLPDLIASLQV